MTSGKLVAAVAEQKDPGNVLEIYRIRKYQICVDDTVCNIIVIWIVCV